MHIIVIQAILIGFLYFLCQSGTPWLTAFMGNYVRQPLVNGAIVGLIMGDPVQVLIIGSAINLPCIGMTLRMLMSKKSVILFFLLGFLMVTYQGFSMIVVALFAIIIAYFYTDLSSKRTGE